jgi:hypothetical protein
VGVRSYERGTYETRWSAPPGPGVSATLFVFVVALVILVANGRPIGEPDTRGAAGFILRGAVDVASRAGLEVDRTGAAVLGKLLAAFCAALAAAGLFAAAARRHGAGEGRWAAFALVLGTTLAAAAQGWSGEAPATAAVALALWLLARAEDEAEPRVAARAGLPLALAGALQPTAAPLALVLGVAALVRWRASWLAFLLWAVPGAAAGAAAAIASSSANVPAAASGDPGPLALLASPAKGALVFAPAALVGVVGLVAALRSSRARRLWDQPEPGRLLPAACAAGVVAHFTSVAVLGDWSHGVFWGPRLVAPAWPLLMLFVPEGLAALRLLGVLLVVGSVGIQAIGALTYDGRWDRLNRDARGDLGAVTWLPARSPLVFQWHERVARASLPALEGRRVVVREHAIVGRGEDGSFVSFRAGRQRPTGADATMEALRLEQGARVVGDRLELRTPGDGWGFRVREGARPRRLELRVVGSGQGTLAVAERSFWKAVRVRERTVTGAFRLRLPYAFDETHAGELSVTLRSGGPLAIQSFSLVPPSEPENVIRLP